MTIYDIDISCKNKINSSKIKIIYSNKYSTKS